MDDSENYSVSGFDNEIERKFVADSNEVVHFKLGKEI